MSSTSPEAHQAVIDAACVTTALAAMAIDVHDQSSSSLSSSTTSFVEREFPTMQLGETYTTKEYWEQLANNNCEGVGAKGSNIFLWLNLIELSVSTAEFIVLDFGRPQSINGWWVVIHCLHTA